MGLPLQREDVERHLKELGYRNISDEQLDEFIKDLKRLIRYEEKQRRLKDLLQLRRNEAERKKEKAASKRSKAKAKEVSPDRCSNGSTSSGHFSSSEHELEEQDRVDGRSKQQQHQRRPLRRSVSYCSEESYSDAKHSTSSSSSTSSSTTVSSSSTSTPSPRGPADHHKVKVKIEVDEKSSNFADAKSSKPNVKRSATFDKKISDIDKARSKIDEMDFGRPKLVRPKSSSSIVYEQVLPKQPEFPAKPTCSFIRPPPDRLIPKSDPVQLYRFYKECWSKTKFPGDESTNQLRWRVREWMMGHRE